MRGEQKQQFLVSGDHAWNVVPLGPVPAPVALGERQSQLWATPHGVVKAALAHSARLEGRAIAFAVPGRFTPKATVDRQNLIERVEAVIPRCSCRRTRTRRRPLHGRIVPLAELRKALGN